MEHACQTKERKIRKPYLPKQVGMRDSVHKKRRNGAWKEERELKTVIKIKNG